MNLFQIIIYMSVFISTQAHICIVDPPQRAGFNISDAGDNSCYRKDAPCGNNTPGKPTSLVSGQAYTMFFQQNFNHYEVGYPGSMDVSWSRIPNPKSEDDFEFILTIPDFNAHNQANQRNFSVDIVIPNYSCDECVLRVRYVPNKPTENIFYQCSDIAISQVSWTPSYYGLTNLLSSNGDAMTASLNGYSIERNTLLQVPLSQIQFNIRRDSNPLIADQIVTASPNSLYYLASTSGVIGAPFDAILQLNFLDFETSVIYLTGSVPINIVALHFDNQDNSIYAIALNVVDFDAGIYQYALYQVNLENGNIGSPVILLPNDNTYVNFQWSTLDTSGGLIYLLTGNENDPYGLSTKLFTIPLDGSNYTVTKPDNSVYTIAAIHYDLITGDLFSVSPGLWGKKDWTLVKVNPQDGTVTPVHAYNATMNSFISAYSGEIFGFDVASRIIWRLFCSDTTFTYGSAVGINIETGELIFTKESSFGPVSNFIYIRS